MKLNLSRIFSLFSHILCLLHRLRKELVDEGKLLLIELDHFKIQNRWYHFHEDHERQLQIVAND